MRINYNVNFPPPEKATDSKCLSVIVPVYNAETSIENCINSILAIKNFCLDIILVDDGSNDSSGKICDKYSNNMGCIRTLHKINGGVASARNAGLNVAKGKWILFVDADDLVLDGISKCKPKQDGDLICFNWIYNDNQQIEQIEDAILCDYKLHKYLSHHMLQFRFRCPWGKLFNRHIIEKYNLRFDESLSIGEDTIFVLDYLKHCKKLQLISSTAYQYTRPQPSKRVIPFPYSKSYISKFLDKYNALGIPCLPLLMQQEYYFFEEIGDASFKGWIKRERCKDVCYIQNLCWKKYSWRRKMIILAYRIISKLKGISMNKKIRAVSPYAFQGKPSFKQQPYDAWGNVGGKIAAPHYPAKAFHGLVYKCDFPSMGKHKDEARLRFVEPVSLTFDTFPDYMWYEMIPMIWDCWPKYFDRVARWLRKHQVKTAIFTSSQTAARMQEVFPKMNILAITEGIDTQPYQAGNDLRDRSIDLLEYGSILRNFFHHHVVGIKHINRENANGCMDSFSQLLNTMADAKITISLPRCDTAPEETGGIETLTQRFWEGMLSRTVLLGRAPRELIDLIGYNPVIDLDKNHPDEQVRDIVSHISDYQELVDKNRETALRMAPWEIRMKKIMTWLESLGYQI